MEKFTLPERHRRLACRTPIIPHTIALPLARDVFHKSEYSTRQGARTKEFLCSPRPRVARPPERGPTV
jgi:hypothetical protein